MNDAARFVGAAALWSVLVLFLFGDETSGDLLQMQAAALTLALVCADVARLTRSAPTPPACPCRDYGAECVAVARDYGARVHGRPRREDTTPHGSFSYQEGQLPLGTMTSRELAETEDD